MFKKCIHTEFLKFYVYHEANRFCSSWSWYDSSINYVLNDKNVCYKLINSSKGNQTSYNKNKWKFNFS